MENYMYYTTMGGRAKIKVDVVPHKFSCQPNRKRQSSTVLRPAAEKRRRQQILQEILTDESYNENIQNNDPQECLIETMAEDQNLVNVEEDTSSNLILITKIDVSTQTTIQNCTAAVIKTNAPKFRSKAVQCKLPSVVDQKCSPIKTSNRSIATSPIKLLNKISQREENISSCSYISHNNSSYDIYEPSESDGCSSFTSGNSQLDTKEREVFQVTDYLINKNLKAYTGIPYEWNMLLERMSATSGINIANIKLSLMKIRRQDTFERLSEQFGMSVSNASIIFSKTVPVLAHLLKTLIYMPDPNNIKRILPIPFRSSYSHVNSIIDAFEIQIEKPSDPENQSLTWSEYKKCNTLKYLISCTPDGFINFISKGFGGRISDELLFEQCGLIELLPEYCAIMADRGFKNIVSLLDDKNIELIRPPSVSSGIKLSQAKVLEGKRIAALRIHVERVIGRIREFDFLKPHAVINHNMLSYTDHVVIIAAALVNLQSPIIST